VNYWQEIVALAIKAGSSEQEIRDKVEAGHTILWPTDDGLLLLDCATDGALVAWLGAGRNLRKWFAKAEAEIAEFARTHGCDRMRIEGRQGWKRILPHWEVVSDGDLVILERRI